MGDGSLYRFQNVVRITNKGPGTARELNLRVSVPTTKKHHQEVLKLRTMPVAKIRTERFGNASAVYEFAELKPGRTVECSFDAEILIEPMNYRIVSSSRTGDIPASIRRFTEPDVALESQHPRIKYLASKLAHFARAPIRFVVKASKTVNGYLNYEVQSKERGAAYAIEQRVGDCTEFSALLVALCRANNIPARLLSGYLHDSYGWGAHAWMEFWFHDRWIPMDPTNHGYEGLLGVTDNFILTRIGNWMNPKERSSIAIRYRSSGAARPSISSSFDVSRLQQVHHTKKSDSPSNAAIISIAERKSKSKSISRLDVRVTITKRKRIYENTILTAYAKYQTSPELLLIEPIRISKDGRASTIVDIRKSKFPKMQAVHFELRSKSSHLLCQSTSRIHL